MTPNQLRPQPRLTGWLPAAAAAVAALWATLWLPAAPAESAEWEGGDPFDESSLPAHPEWLRELLRATEDGGGGVIELDADDLESVGGVEELRRLLEESGGDAQVRLLEPGEDGFEGLLELLGLGRGGEDEQFRQVIEALRPVIATARRSTLQVLRDGRKVALATAVREDGYLVTKASELERRDEDGEDGAEEPAPPRLEVEDSEKERFPAQVVKTFPTEDLALLRAEGAKLVPVQWYHPEEPPELGTFLAAPGTGEDAIAFGLISVAVRNLDQSQRGFLGISMEVAPGGIRVRQVVRGTAAERAGLRRGDVITALDGKRFSTPRAFAAAVSSRRPEDSLKIDYQRGEEKRTATATLGTRALGPDRLERFNLLDRMGGPLSRNRAGYPAALQHDLPISPRECGGPLVDLEGRVLGVNIARAGRIKTYALPGAYIEDLLVDLKPGGSIELQALEEALSRADDQLKEVRALLKEARDRRQKAARALDQARDKAGDGTGGAGDDER